MARRRVLGETILVAEQNAQLVGMVELRAFDHIAMRAGDTISIVSLGWLHDGQTLAHKAKMITLDSSNRVLSLTES